MFSSTVNIDLGKLVKYQKDVEQQLNGAPGPVNDAMKLWAVRYRSYTQLRFDSFSRGGGDWRPLALSTVKARRKGKYQNKTRSSLANKNGKSVSAGGAVTILRDTGLLFAALSPVFSGTPGALEERIPFGIRIGYGGPQRHASKDGKGKQATIADIASFHQNGAIPRMPARQIIVKPDAQLLSIMSQDMEKALNGL